MSVLLQQSSRLAAALPPLLVEAERVAHAVQQGLHGRRRTGAGETFWQFRPYAYGDAAHRIDWRQSARNDRAFVREREWEAAQSVYVWADASGSMNYHSRADVPTKVGRVQLLMLALISLLQRGGEKPIWLHEDAKAVLGKPGLERLAYQLEQDCRLAPRLPPVVRMAQHGQIILCSDFLMSPENIQELMRRYATMNLRGVLLHVIDPAEEGFTFDGRLEVSGCEDEDKLLVPNAKALREAYLKRFKEHQIYLKKLAAGARWSYQKHVTTEAAHIALLRLYENLAAGKK